MAKNRSGSGPLQMLFKRLPNGKLKNIAAGYWEHDDDGNPSVFHPIRASYDYNSKRAGESGSGKRKSKAKGQKRTTKRAPARKVKKRR